MAKISIHSNEFTQPIAEALDRGKALVIWHQIPWAGGDQEWFLIHRFEALDSILRRGRVASAFTAYEWIEVLASRQVNQEWSKRQLHSRKSHSTSSLSLHFCVFERF